MITFHNDALAPPELCRLLYQTIPERFHVPVVFLARDEQMHNLIPSSFLLKWLGVARTIEDETALGGYRHDLIAICLHRVWTSKKYVMAGSTEFKLWYKLLKLTYHEFGHIATKDEFVSMEHGGYDWEEVCEALANIWAERHIQLIASRDKRLAQPKTIKGYLGARLIQSKGTDCRHWGWGSAKVQRIKDWRCYQTHAQFSAGDVVRKLGLFRFPGNKYDLLRYLSKDVGITYMDSAGRKHKLYTYGDLEILERRLPTGLIGYRSSRRVSDAQFPLFVEPDRALLAEGGGP